MLVLLELREKLQWLLVILCEKLNKMEMSSLVKKERYIYIYINLQQTNFSHIRGTSQDCN